MEETKKNQEQQASDELEIVELDDRLDMAFDPLSMLLAPRPTNGNCGNSQCCGGKLLM
jgi:hypothetical protein